MRAPERNRVAASPDPSSPLETTDTSIADSADRVGATWEALGSVYDPELCLDVVSLGLVYGVHDRNGTVVVDMTLTTPGCPAAESLPAMARVAVQDNLGGTTAVEVRVVWNPPWSPAMMNDDAARALGFRSR